MNIHCDLKLDKYHTGDYHDDIFISDLHGEADKLKHVLRLGSATLDCTISRLFSETTSHQYQRLLTRIIYYPDDIDFSLYSEDKIACIAEHLVLLCKDRGASLVGELPVLEKNNVKHVIQWIKKTANALRFTASPNINVVGDIYDRGPGAHEIMETLAIYPNVNIQWGNHDIIWMAAALGSEACCAIVLRICLRYGNLETLSYYGIDLTRLANFSDTFYKEDPCEYFQAKALEGGDGQSVARMHKAIAIIQFKLEEELIRRRPEFSMQERLVLSGLNLERNELNLDGNGYPLRDALFPTMQRNSCELLSEERQLIHDLCKQFVTSEALQRHVRYLYEHGAIHSSKHDILATHGCIPLNEDGSFMSMNIDDKELHGRHLLEEFDRQTRIALQSELSEAKTFALDLMWYLWNGPCSPLFGKQKMTTFERYFIDNKTTHHEGKNTYFTQRENPATMNAILEEFSLSPSRGRIINGHVPVRVPKGESAIKAQGKLLAIDGGFSQAYTELTKIGGYLVIRNRYGIFLKTLASTSSKNTYLNFASDEKTSEEQDDENYCEVECIALNPFFEKYVNTHEKSDEDNGLTKRGKLETLKKALAQL